MHAIRRNPDVTVLVYNNRIYGLTKGQASPTSDVGMRTKMQPNGVVSRSFNPLAAALAKKAHDTGKAVRQVSLEEKVLPEEALVERLG